MNSNLDTTKAARTAGLKRDCRWPGADDSSTAPIAVTENRSARAGRPSQSRGFGSRKPRFIRVVAAAAILSAATLTGVVTSAGVASAQGSTLTGISVKVTTAQCPKGGSVSKATAAITAPGSSGVSPGDTVTGLTAQTGLNQINGTNFCRTNWWGGGYYWYWSVNRYIWNSGQTTYV